MNFMNFIITTVVTGLLVYGILVGLAKFRNCVTGDDQLKEGERRGQIYSLAFKESSDVELFRNIPDLDRAFLVKNIDHSTVVVESPLHESEIRDYLKEHLQIGPEKVVVALLHNPAISLSTMM